MSTQVTVRFSLCHRLQFFHICRCLLILIVVYLFSPAEWSQRDLERNENVKFCRQYIVFHDDESVVYSGASGNCTEIKGEYVNILSFHLEWCQRHPHGSNPEQTMSNENVSPVRLLSKDSPTGEMKAVVRECTIKGEDKQFLEVCGCLSGSDSALSPRTVLCMVLICVSALLRFPPVTHAMLHFEPGVFVFSHLLTSLWPFRSGVKTSRWRASI